MVRRGFDIRTWTYMEEMYKRPPKEWKDAGTIFGNPHEHDSTWVGYIIDSKGNKRQVLARWILNEFMENNLEITIPHETYPVSYTMYKTGKVTFHGEIKFFEESLPDKFRFTWTGNCRTVRFKDSEQRAFRVHRKDPLARI